MASSGAFTAFRSNGAPTYYGSNKTPFMADILESGLIYAFVIVTFSFYVILPGIRGNEVSIYIGDYRGWRGLRTRPSHPFEFSKIKEINDVKQSTEEKKIGNREWEMYIVLYLWYIVVCMQTTHKSKTIRCTRSNDTFYPNIWIPHFPLIHPLT